MSVRMFKVGGCIRDEMLGLRVKDIDFAVEIETFDAMRAHLIREGFRIHEERPEFQTIRCGIPPGHRLRDVAKDADFVQCRKDGAYSDGRRPDQVTPGSIFDDLKRRDFTVNAMAVGDDGVLLDPHGGRDDITARLLRCVGSPIDRFQEDALRAVRAIRFAVTKGFTISPTVTAAMHSEFLPPLVAKVAAERRRDELIRAFAHDTMLTFDVLAEQPRALREAMLTGLRLSPTMRTRGLR